MPIPIPIGVKRVVAVQGAAWKFVCCTHCGQDYAYLMELEATGADLDLLFLDAEGSAKRAQAQAEQNLLKQTQNVVLPVPCPYCGFYQADMVRGLKDEATGSGPVIAGLVVMAVSFIPLAFSIPYIWILTVVGLIVGLSLVGYSDMAASLSDPNSGDAKPRKLLGQKYAVWGEQLDELLMAQANVDSSAPPNDAGKDGTPSQSGKSGAGPLMSRGSAQASWAVMFTP